MAIIVILRPPVETRVVSIVPPGHPCLFTFPFFSSYFLSLATLRFPFPFRFVDFRFFLVWRSSFFFSLPGSPWWRILLFFLGTTPPPRCLRACKSACYPCVVSSFLRPCFFFVLCFFLSSSLFRFRFGHRLFHHVFFLWV